MDSKGRELELPVGKVVCVGRNYAAHARELNNPLPDEPVLFMKHSNALVPISPNFSIPKTRGSCHVETELSLLIGSRLCNADEEQARKAVIGLGIGLDLTLRDLQSELKAKSLPWEKAKAFDGSCPLSAFVPAGECQPFDQLGFSLDINKQRQQTGQSNAMLTPLLPLLAYISSHFTLMPGDVVLSGTPAGVCALTAGDSLDLDLDGCLQISTVVN